MDGGVLEILPTEASNILLPNLEKLPDEITNDLLETINKNVKNNYDIRITLDLIDKEILNKYLHISFDDICKFREIWECMSSRRLERGR